MLISQIRQHDDKFNILSFTFTYRCKCGHEGERGAYFCVPDRGNTGIRVVCGRMSCKFVYVMKLSDVVDAILENTVLDIPINMMLEELDYT